MKRKRWTLTVAFILAAGITEAAVVTPIAGGFAGAIGQAVHPTTQEVFFVEYGTGRLKKLNPFTAAVSTVVTGFTNPEDVALLPGYPLAYVTTRDGKLWKASTGSNTKSLVASGLGLPHQLVLDPAAFVGYTVDFSGGNLYRVQLGGGATTTLVSGLTNPIGLLMSSDFKTAWVAEPNRILEIDIASSTTTIVASGLLNNFFMDWADDAHSAIFVVARDPGNRLLRVDLTGTPATVTAIAAVPFRPSSVVRSADPNVVYVASDAVTSKVTLAPAGGPIITRLGHVPSTEIDWTTGLATTDPGYYFHVKNASFGSSVHVMLNFPNIRSMGGAYYRVYAGGTLQQETWKNYKWNGFSFVPETVVPTGGFYDVPPSSELWATPDLGFILDTKGLPNGRQLVYVFVYNASKSYIGAYGAVAIQVDNTQSQMDIEEVWHDGVKLDECALVTSGSPNLDFVFTARDGEGHLFNYRLVDRWGSGHSALVTEDHYIGVHDSSTTWSGVSHASVSYTLSNTACSHSFALHGWSNTINGFNRIHEVTDLEHIAIYLGGPTCKQ